MLLLLTLMMILTITNYDIDHNVQDYFNYFFQYQSDVIEIDVLVRVTSQH